MAVLAYILPALLVRLSLFFDRGDKQVSVDEKEKILVFPPEFDVTFEATNSASYKLSGYSQKGETIEIFINGISKKKVQISPEGSFEVEIKLYEGENEIYAIAFDKNKNKSDKSETATIFYKTGKPKLELETPSEEKSTASKRNIKIEGKTDPEAAVRINERWVLVKSDGSFTFEASLADGENKFQIIAQDEAGNSTESLRIIAYTPN